jgi:HEPN domain-containing protein
MDEAKAALVRDWLIKAHSDLASARKLGSDPDAYLDTAIYHCQQAAEKALKALLVYHDQRFEKTHDLRHLLGLAVGYQPSLSTLTHSAAQLNPYAVAFRYPDERMEPSREEFESALAAAQELIDQIISLLPTETHPS